MAPKRKAPTPEAKAPNVFIAWAGERSKVVASKLATWLPTVIDAVQPWMSEESLRSGATWFSEIMRQLTSIEIGVVCLTPENLDARWIHFEAGALANKVTANKRLIPYLIGLEPTEVTAPLSFFQHRKALQEPTSQLVKDINEATGSTVSATSLEKKFKAFWPELEEVLKTPAPKVHAAKERTTDQMIRELLELVRGIRADVVPTIAAWGNVGYTKIGPDTEHLVARNYFYDPLMTGPKPLGLAEAFSKAAGLEDTPERDASATEIRRLMADLKKAISGKGVKKDKP